MRFAQSLALAITLCLVVASAHGAGETKSRGYFGFSSKPTGVGNSRSAIVGSSPTIVTKMTSGTKRLVTNTKNMFHSKKSESTKRSGTTAFYPSKNDKDQKQGFFQSIFNPEPPPPPKTVKEWMQLKQIHP